MTLDMINKGEFFKIKRIPNKKVRAQILRLGAGEGALAKCYEKVPGGPVIIKKNLQEIAIGRGLARTISIEK